MKYRLRTTIGNVNVTLDGHFVQVSTEQESCRNLNINLRDPQSGRIVVDPTIDSSFQATLNALREYFPAILVLGVIDFQAPLMDLMQSEVFRKFGSHPLAGIRP